MTRRSSTGGEPIKARRRKAAPLKRAGGPKDARRRGSAGLNKNVALLTRERDEALEQQTATSEVLSIIRRSPADAQPVFDAIVQSAARLCGAIFSAVYLYEDDHVHIAATNNFSPEAARRAVELREQKRPDRSHLGGRAILDRAIVHVPDVLNDPEYSREWALAGGWRAVLAVPLLRDGKPVGAVTVAKAEPKPFSDRQVQLLNSFADQALIAIENARLFEAEQQRTRELTESLEQQTATSEVLGVISRSPGDLQSVFAAMLENAVRICDATFGNIYRWEDDALHLVAAHNTPPAWIEARRRSPLRAAQNPDIGRMIVAKTTLHVTDATTMPGYIDRSDPASVGAVELGGIRTALAVPMLRENELIGSFTLYRQEVRPFTDKQIELIENFAAQAVIAIENARLLNELRQRTDDLTERTAGLTEALEQQTATSEILQVISGSPGDLQPVFATMLEKAVRICDAKFGTLYLAEEGRLRLVAAQQVPEYLEARGRVAFEPAPGGALDETMRTKQTVQVADLAATKPYIERHPTVVEAVELGGIRTAVAVPMLKEDKLVGIITIVRQEVRLFTDKQIALVTNFAAQAVIAIENARLFEAEQQRTRELLESLEQQTATSDVLRVIIAVPTLSARQAIAL